VVVTIHQSNIPFLDGSSVPLALPIDPFVVPHAIPAAGHRMSSKFGLSMKSLTTPTAVAVPMTWPNIVFLGCANGDSIVLYSKTAAAPCTSVSIALLKMGAKSYETPNEEGRPMSSNLWNHKDGLNDYDTNKRPQQSPASHQHIAYVFTRLLSMA